MPDYAKTISLAKDQEKKETIRVKGDYLTYLRIRFMKHTFGLVDIALFYGNKQLLPEEEGTFYRGEDEVITWEGKIKLYEKITPLTIYAKNNDSSNAHSVNIKLTTKYKHELPEERISKEIRKFVMPIAKTFAVLTRKA